MSSFLGQFAVAAGQDTPVPVAQGGLAGVLIGNESGLPLIVKVGSNYSRSLYPGVLDYFPIPSGNFSGEIILSAKTALGLNNTSSWPSSYAQVDAVGAGEKITGVYPMALPRAVNNVNSNATAVTNFGFALGTIFISGSVVGDSPGTAEVQIFNNGQQILGSNNYSGDLKVTGPASYNTELNGNGEIKMNSLSGVEIDLQGSGVAQLGQPLLTMRDTNGNSILLSPYVQTISGTTGTITVMEYFYGSFRAVFVRLSNYTNGAAAQIVLPNAFVGRSQIRTGTIGTGGVASFLKASVAQNISIVTALAAAGGTVAAAQTTINQHSFGELQSGWDTLQISALASSTSGTMRIEGI